MVATEKSLANLIPLDSKRASEIGKLNKNRPQTARESFAVQKYCNEACCFFESCPASSTSRTLDISKFIWEHRKWTPCPKRELRKHEKGKVPCFIKAQPQEVQFYFTELFGNGEGGLIKVMMDIHFKLMLKTHKRDVSAKELRDALTSSIDLKKGIYGDKSKLELSGCVVNIIDNIPKPEKKDADTP